jgi:hypothetical protein
VLRANLSTRPFYNERAVHVVLGFIAVLVLALTAYNVLRILTLSHQNTEISIHANRDRAEADRLTQEATRVRRGLNQSELKLVAAAALEANVIIDQRTFSWTEFFNRIEATLPPDVMLSAVRPRITDEGTRVTMGVLGRRAEDVDEFMEKLEETGAFADVLPTQEELTDEGLHKVVLEAVYIPGGGSSQPDATPQGGPAPSPGGHP